MMLQAVETCPVILTRYVGPTDKKPGRVKATSGSGKSVFISWDHELDVFENHAAAAAALVEKLEAAGGGGWRGRMVGGSVHNGGYAFAIVKG